MPILEAMTASAASSGLVACAGALADSMYSEFRLVRTVRRAVSRTRQPPNKLADRLEGILTKSFGHEDKLDEVVDRTLRSLAASRILPHLTQCALIEFEPRASLKFLAYAHYTGGGFEFEAANQFALQLWSALQAVANDSGMQAVLPPSLRSFGTTRKERENRIRQIEAQYSAVVSEYVRCERANKKFAVSGMEVLWEPRDAEALLPYLIAHHYEMALNDVDVHSASGEVQRERLDNVFIDAPLISVPRSDVFFRYREMRRHHHAGGSRIGWEKFLTQTKRTVLLGDPGGGKSTLSKKLCVELARDAQKGGLIIPIFVQLRGYAAFKVQVPSGSLFDYIVEILAGISGSFSRGEIASQVDFLFRAGHVFMVFDGVDEVLASGRRRDVAKEVSDFADRYPASRFLVTSRFVGYEIASLPDFDHMAVGALDDDCIEELFVKVSKSILKKKDAEIEQTKPHFVKDATNKARELMSNPLLLTLIIIIHSKRREIPDNRASLYSACAELLFDRWDSYRAINPNLPERYRLFDLLMHFSSLLYENEELGGRMSTKELEKHAREFFADDYIDNKEGRSAEAAKALVDHLTGRAWILHEVGEDVFEFTHRTFLEYFYAKNLEAQNEGTVELVRAIGSRPADGAAVLPAHLALQIRTKDKRSHSTKVVETLLEILLHDDRPEFVRFCSDTLKYLLPSAKALQEFSYKIAQSALRQNMDDVLISMLATETPQSNYIEESVLSASEMCRSIAEIKLHAELFDDLAERFNWEKGGEIFESCVKSRAEEFKAFAKRSPFIAKLALDWFGDYDAENVEKHALRIWADYGDGAGRSDTRCRDGLEMLIGIVEQNEKEGPRSRRMMMAGLGRSIFGAGRPDRIGSRLGKTNSFYSNEVPKIDVTRVSDKDVIAVAMICLFIAEAELSHHRPPQSAFVLLDELKNARPEQYAHCALDVEGWIDGEWSFYAGSSNASEMRRYHFERAFRDS